MSERTDEARFAHIAGTVAHDVRDVSFLCQYIYRLRRRLAAAETAGDIDPATDRDPVAIHRRAPFAYGQWRSDLAYLLEQVDAQAARLAAVEQLLQEADITCSCCQSWVETLQAALHAGAVGAAEETHEQ
jgi:hypothetical protein